VGNQDTIKQDELTSLSSADVIDHFLTQPHPRSLSGPWLAGWALDFHSRFVGKEHIRSSTGSLVFRYKYDGEFHLAGELSRNWLDLLADHPELPHADVVIPIPPSTPRERDPVIHLAQKLADHLKIPALVKALVKTRATRPQKEMKSLAAKKANIAGSFALRENVKALNLLLVDDLYDSGATLSEAAHTLSHNRPASIVVLTLTKTIHTDK
jgi:predicted amidophosphoribosyltransferase